MSSLRRRMMMTFRPSGGVKFPAVITFNSDMFVGNIDNYNIANYFIETYPNMVADTRGRYTPINESVTIGGSGKYNDKVLGVAKWTDTPTSALIFYTARSINNFEGVRVYVAHDVAPKGATSYWFFD